MPGAYVGHLFDDETNELKGHATWQRVDETSPVYSTVFVVDPPGGLTDEERAAATANYIAIGILLAEIAAPLVKGWWDAKGALMLRSAWARLPWRRTKHEAAVVAAPLPMNQASFIASATGVEIAVVHPGITMTSAEWAARYRAMLAAGDFADEQRRMLANARIEAGAAPEQLTVQQFADRIAPTLKAHPSILDPEISAEFTKVFSTQMRHSQPGRPALGR
jgi:hypothetical protein